MDTEKARSQQDVKDILGLAWKRKWLIIIPMILVAAVTFAGSYLITPQYESSAIIQIDPEVQLTREVQGLLGQQTGYRRMSNTERRNQLNSYYNEITSSKYTRLLNDRLQLDRQPSVDKIATKYVQAQPNMSLEDARLNVLQGQLKEQISVDWASGDQIRISVQSTDPMQARDISNTLGDIFIDEKVKQELNQIRSSQDFSDIQLEKYELRLAEKVRARTNTEKELMTIELDESITSESNRSEIAAEIDRTKNEVSELQNQEKEILKSLAAVPGISTSKLNLVDSDDKGSIQSELKQQLRSIGGLMIKYTWSDPQILNFKLRQNNLLNQIEIENRKLVGEQFSDYDNATRQNLVNLFNIRTNLDYLYSKRPYLQSAMDELTSKMNLIPEYQARLAQLDREIAAATDIRDRFKLQQESSTISQALVQDMSSTKYRKVEPAKLAIAPFTPDRKKILMMGIMLGLIVGCAAALLVEMLDNSFKKVEDVEEMLGLPVIGVTPKIEFLKKVG